MRLDGDDFNVKGRTDFQVDYMEKNPFLIMSSANAYLTINNKNKNSLINNYKPPFEEYFRPYTSVISSIDIHPTMIFRIEPFIKYKIRYGALPIKF